MNPAWPPEIVNDGEPGWGSPPVVPFPVNAPFQVRADLSRLAEPPQAASAVLTGDPQYPRYARIKLAHLNDTRRPLVRWAPGVSPLRQQAVLDEAIGALAAAAPAFLDARTPGCVRVRRAGLVLYRAGQDWLVDADHPSARPLVPALAALSPGARALAAVSLGLQEDLALMGYPEAGAPSASLDALGLSVVFPSGWDPAEKLGQGLGAIHGPVADGEALRRASANLARAMVEKGPFERHVWTLTADAALARWPGDPRPAAVPHADPATLFFRCERQVTVPLPRAGASLFLIRVHVAPLGEVCADPQRRSRLVASLRSMSESVVAYKGIAAIREQVLATWGEGR